MTRGETKSSLCRACNELLLIKQLFSFCFSSSYSSLLKEQGGFPCANNKSPRFFPQFWKVLPTKSLGYPGRDVKCQPKKKGAAREKQAEFSFIFAGKQNEKIELLRVTCHTLDELHLVK